mmetsp:Transcript_24360/g.27019  ORF Transcript_24360/g.27019 Transcript_24360/m.27019 type:complete len:108 (+) Transcript_24360:3-326(+)
MGNGNTKSTNDLYRCPGSGKLRKRSPQYSIPKGKTRSYLDAVQKLARRNPSPGDHHTNLTWIHCQSLKPGKGSERITIIDKIMKEQKKFPAPNTYRILEKHVSPLGK